MNDWLEKEGLTQSAFAERVGISPATVSLLVRGHVWLSRATARRIAEVTKGEVTAHDFAVGKSH